jgi:outer membrane protein TolC
MHSNQFFRASRAFAVTLSLLALAAPLTAETLHLSRADVVRLALANGTSVQLAEASLERARSGVVDARSALLPEAQAKLLRYNQSINLETFGFALPGQPAVVGPFNVTDAQIAAAMNLFDLAAYRRYQASRLGVTASRFDVQNSENELAAAALRLYTIVQKAEALIGAREANVELYRDLSKLAHDQFEAGTATRLDTSRADVQLARERQSLLSARNQREAARLALLHAIGADQSSTLVLTDPVAIPAHVPSVDEGLATARRDRLDLRAAEERRHQAETTAAAARAARYPSLGIDLLGDMSGNHSNDLHWSRRLGAGLSIPIFTGGRISNTIAETAVSQHELAIRTTELQRQIEEDVRRSVLSMESALARIAVSNESVRLAGEELTVARDRVANGVGASIEVDRAEDSLRQAREDAIDASTDAAIAQIDYERATGSIRGVAAAAGALTNRRVDGSGTNSNGAAPDADLAIVPAGATPAARPSNPAAMPPNPTSAPTTVPASSSPSSPSPAPSTPPPAH